MCARSTIGRVRYSMSRSRARNSQISVSVNFDPERSGTESPPIDGLHPGGARKSLISAANCGAQDQIRKLLSDSEIDVNEQSTKVPPATQIKSRTLFRDTQLYTALRVKEKLV